VGAKSSWPIISRTAATIFGWAWPQGTHHRPAVPSRMVAVHILVVHALGRDQQARIGLEVAVVGKWHPKRRHGFWPGLVHGDSPKFLQAKK
jgi:hypothetical protein